MTREKCQCWICSIWGLRSELWWLPLMFVNFWLILNPLNLCVTKSLIRFGWHNKYLLSMSFFHDLLHIIPVHIYQNCPCSILQQSSSQNFKWIFSLTLFLHSPTYFRKAFNLLCNFVFVETNLACKALWMKNPPLEAFLVNKFYRASTHARAHNWCQLPLLVITLS